MPKPRGREHTTLTETASQVVKELYKIPGIKMIAPGEIKTASKRGGKRFVTLVKTTSGCELIITGQSVQKVSVHTDNVDAIIPALKRTKTLQEFSFKQRSRKPGV